VELKLKVVGGKGGFGALLRGAGARSGKKVTQDDCRDLNGRRIRHVKNEQKLAEWYQQQKQRELAQKQQKEQELQRKREEDTPKSSFDNDKFNKEIREITENVQSSVEEGIKEAIRRKQEEKKKRLLEEQQLDEHATADSKGEPTKKRRFLWYVAIAHAETT
jgi:hypothetical protein